MRSQTAHVACVALLLAAAVSSAHARGLRQTPAAAALAPAGPAATTTTQDLPPFTAISSCLPFNVLVVPSSGAAAHSLSLMAQPAVGAALVAGVDNGTLYLGWNASFATSQPIRLTVALPGNKLANATNRGLGSIFINPGFVAPGGVNVTVAAASSGGVFARALNASRVSVKTTGTGDVFVRGDIGTADVSGSGTSTITLSGVRDSVYAQLTGASTLYVDAVSDNTYITTTAEAASTVYTNKGKCNFEDKGIRVDLGVFNFEADLSNALNFGTCEKVTDAADYPSYTAKWSCGLQARGAALCLPAAIAAQKAAQAGSAISIATPTSSQAAPSPQAAPPATTPPAVTAAPAAAAAPPPPSPIAPAVFATGPAAVPAAPSPAELVAATAPKAPAGAASPPAATVTAPLTPERPTPAAAPAAASAFVPAAAAAPVTSAPAPAPQQPVSPVVANPGDIRVAAAGRRLLSSAQGVSDFVAAHADMRRVLYRHQRRSSSASSDEDGVSSVFVSSTECDAADAQLFIPA